MVSPFDNDDLSSAWGLETVPWASDNWFYWGGADAVIGDTWDPSGSTLEVGEPGYPVSSPDPDYDASTWFQWIPGAKPYPGGSSFSVVYPGVDIDDLKVTLWGTDDPTPGFGDLTEITPYYQAAQIIDTGGYFYSEVSDGDPVWDVYFDPTAFTYFYLQVLTRSAFGASTFFVEYKDQGPRYWDWMQQQITIETTGPFPDPDYGAPELTAEMSISLGLEITVSQANDFPIRFGLQSLFPLSAFDMPIELGIEISELPSVNTAAPGDGGGIGISLTANLTVFPPPDIPALLIRPFTINSLVMPDVPVVAGYPHVPLVWCEARPTLELIQGSGHIRAIADPDPADPSNSGDPWGQLTPPKYYWTIKDLTAPSASGYALSEWPEHNGGPSWHSEWDYRPQVRSRHAFGKKNSQHTYTAAVHFNPSTAEHMWVDLHSQPQPYTWLFAGVINSYPTRTYGHYILDGGKEPPHHWDAHQDRHFTESGVPNRSLMLFQRSSALLFTDQVVETGQYVRVTHNYVPRPRVMFGVFNGASSKVGWRDPAQHMMKRGKVSNHNHRYWVTGRRWANVSDNLASHMTLFEIRFFNKALSDDQIKKHYKQLAGTYKFNLYGEK